MEAINLFQTPGEITVRSASQKDKKAVLNISDNLYDGRDYLPEYYQHFIDNPDITPYVCEKDGKVVGFIVSHLVDDGQTMVIRTGRVNNKYRDEGIAKLLLWHAMVQDLAGGKLRRIAFTGLHDPTTTPTSLIPLTTTSLAHDAFSYVLVPARVRLEQGPVVGVKSVSEQDIQHYMKTDHIRRYLFPQNRIIVHWVPYLPLPSNARAMMGFDGTCNTIVLSDLEQGQTTCHGLVSFCAWYKCKGSAYSADINWYGADETSLYAHLAALTQRLRQVCSGNLMVFGTPCGPIRGPVVKDAFRALGYLPRPRIGSVNQNTQRAKRFLVETDLLKAAL